jgi:hypothetical protein
MAEKDYREKIKKLLALSESGNENEARSALLKAKELMARHKISEDDLENIKNKKVKTLVTRFTCSKRREPWMVDLSAVIGENFCCQAFRHREWNKQTNVIGFIGFEDDVDACVAIYDYAISCVRDGISKIKKEWQGYSREYRKKLCDGYGFGFSSGVATAFEKQKETDETGWALVMVIPQEVKEMTKNFGSKDFKGAAQENASRSAYLDGYSDGEKFDPSTKLAGDEKEENLALGSK